MAINASVYSSKQFELYIALQDVMGTPNTTVGEFVKLDVVNVSDVDFGGGLVQERNLRTGQQVKKITDHYVSQKGASATLQFEWVVSHKEGLIQLMKLISEDAGTPFVWAGSQSAGTYVPGDDGASPPVSLTTGKIATVIVSNPNTSDDRALQSCALTELTLSMDSGSEGGRLVASGTFYTGFPPTVSANALDVGASGGAETAYVNTIFDCNVKQLGGMDVVAKSISTTVSYPCVRLGFDSSGDAEQYSRSGEIVCSGSTVVKYDANTDQELGFFLAGTSKAVTFTNGTAFGISVPQSVYTGFNLDLGDNEEGVFVEVPFEGTAVGAQNLYSIIVA